MDWYYFWLQKYKNFLVYDAFWNITPKKNTPTHDKHILKMEIWELRDISPASRNPEILEKSNFPKISGFPPQAGGYP